MNKKVLIDANILQYATNISYANDVYAVFDKLKSLGYDLMVSSYTTFEVYRGLDTKRIPKMKQVIDLFSPNETDLMCFSVAAVLDTCYRRYQSTKPYAGRYSDGDLVLAGSSFAYNSPILTANGNDFPRPFFKEIDAALFGSAARPMPIKAQLLMPDITFFNKAIKSYY